MAERIASRVSEHVTENLSNQINRIEDRFCFLLGVKMDDQESIDQFQADIDIWSHQRYQANPALAPSEHTSFMEFRNWARQFYPGIGAYPESRTV